ncbi:integrase [Paraburkholderia graminis]|uniref:tyrosine-type recombinase/integrase n=1 Tax=Paraburkholderia graminis TaxID=60548 RepID=UPI0028566A61|nr:tyrosine-type recombinase/integrase [Paraburkholderia graminis]MDR6467574.1 integrase [Paraburkholderia graminis]
MTKNVTLLPDVIDGQLTYLLLGPDGSRVAAFDAFGKSLLRNCALRTRIAYCRQLASFLDYFFEAAALLCRAGRTISRSVLEEIIEAYDDYLVVGGASGRQIARLVDASMPSPKNSGGTSAQAHAAIRRFLNLSERIRAELSELTRVQVHDSTVDPVRLFPSVEQRVPLSAKQRQALLQNSMLAGVVAGGPQFIQSAVLKASKVEVKFDSSRVFPFDKIADFIDCLPSYRDQSLYSLYAASGCRGHEGRQLLFDDIDVCAGTVSLIAPASRRNHASYLYLEPTEREALCWKGRTTHETLLIEPFATIFFERLELYLRQEYVPHGLHRFVFQQSYKNILGRPYFLSDPSSRRAIFKKAVAKAGIANKLSGDHSMRHSYGTYALNYFPRMNGQYGLPLALVQQLMGHKKAQSTSIYAQYDKDLLREELQYANAVVFGTAYPKSFMELKLQALNALVAQLESKLAA